MANVVLKMCFSSQNRKYRNGLYEPPIMKNKLVMRQASTAAGLTALRASEARRRTNRLLPYIENGRRLFKRPTSV